MESIVWVSALFWGLKYVGPKPPLRVIQYIEKHTIRLGGADDSLIGRWLLVG